MATLYDCGGDISTYLPQVEYEVCSERRKWLLCLRADDKDYYPT